LQLFARSTNSSLNILHTHNQQNQHTCDAETSFTTTKQQKKLTSNPKTNKIDNQKEVAQQMAHNHAKINSDKAISNHKPNAPI
jgi:hypothetical protein